MGLDIYLRGGYYILPCYKGEDRIISEGVFKMRKLVPLAIVAGSLFLVYKIWFSGASDIEKQLSKLKVQGLWDRPLPWFPSVDTLTGDHKKSPDGVSMPSGWSEL